MIRSKTAILNSWPKNVFKMYTFCVQQQDFVYPQIKSNNNTETMKNILKDIFIYFHLFFLPEKLLRFSLIFRKLPSFSALEDSLHSIAQMAIDVRLPMTTVYPIFCSESATCLLQTHAG